MVKAEFQYNFLQASYVFGQFELGDGDVGAQGYELSVQAQVGPGFAVGLNYLSIEGDETENGPNGLSTLNFEGSGVDAYALYYSPVSPSTDFLLGARLDRREFESAIQGMPVAAEQDDERKFLFTGLRYRLQGLEIQGEWFYLQDAEDREDRWSYKIGLLSGNPGQIQLGFTVAPDNEGDVLSVGLRLAY